MKFYGTPKMLVRINKNKAKPKNLKSFRFDENGVFETDNIRLINSLKKRFKYEEENNVIPGEKINEDQIRELAKEKKIKNWHNKKIESLILELKEES